MKRRQFAVPLPFNLPLPGAKRRLDPNLRVVWLIPFLALLALYVVYRVILVESYINYQLVVLVALAYTLTVTFAIFGRFALAFRYNTTQFDDVTYEPSVTVLIPVKNEEKVIASTVRSVLSSYYPSDKLDVIVINDGSSDGTQLELEALKTATTRLTIERFPKNKGKRAALEFGFTHARGEIVVVVDSDTVVRPNCIMEIVKPLSDPAVAGVSGHTDVSDPQSALEKMQAASYFASYLLFKKAEATLGIVTCLPGCASAYRKSAVLRFLNQWRYQTFMGTPCTVGEDRGLTTFLLRDGWRTVYVPTAVTETRVPAKLRTLIRQRVRWKRSFFRESILQSEFMHERWGALYFYPYILTSLIAPFLAVVILLLAPFLFGPVVLGLYVGGIALVSVVYSVYSKIYRPRFSAVWLACWSVFNLLVLNLLSIYAAITITDGKWGTR